MSKQPCFCTCCRQAQFERDQKALAAQRSEPPTDADRIAAAVAVLREYNAITQNSQESIRLAIAILEGRDQ